MKLRRPVRNPAICGITIPELLVVLACLVVLALLLMPASTRCTTKGSRIRCLTNQKQTAAFLLWANDHGQRFPVELASEKEASGNLVLKSNLVANYLAISNELTTPKILVCPEDKKRNPVESFATLTEKNLSYFLNIQTTVTNLNQVLVGDRSITINGFAKRGYVEATNGSRFGWTNTVHRNSGSIALVDGSAHMTNDRFLNDLFQQSEQETIRLLIP